jgi:hypothetical protein
MKSKFIFKKIDSIFQDICIFFLLCKEIRSGCEEFLKNQLDPQNCLGIKSFGELHNCVNLKNSTQEYIYEHFSQIVQNSEEFYGLKAKELEDLIKSNEIEVF